MNHLLGHSQVVHSRQGFNATWLCFYIFNNSKRDDSWCYAVAIGITWLRGKS